MTDADLIIIGGGAAGMTAAVSAAHAGARVMILEHKDRIGKKLLSTGNGRCNLSSRDLSARFYGGSDPSFVQTILDACGLQETLSFFRRIGVPCVSEEERIYPRTMQAGTVLDALRFEITRCGIEVRTQTDVVSARKKGDLFVLHTSDGGHLTSRTLLIAAGGKAAPKTGSDGSANGMIRRFGHKIQPQMPALVPLITTANYRKAVSGVRIHACVKLLSDGRYVQSDTGQVQFTDYGLSGIPVFNVSAQASAILTQRSTAEISLDLLPGISEEETAEELRFRVRSFPDDEVIKALNGFLPKKLTTELLRLCGIRPNEKAGVLLSGPGGPSDPRARFTDNLSELLRIVKDLRQTVTGTKGFDAAQTTAGGVPVCELTQTLESKIVPGLFFAGEITDVHGSCGGYNLQWAWSGGIIAGRAAAHLCTNNKE